jgi:hypothetical protein
MICLEAERRFYNYLMRVMLDRFRARPRLYWTRNGGPYFSGSGFRADYERNRHDIRAMVSALRLLKNALYGVSL